MHVQNAKLKAINIPGSTFFIAIIFLLISLNNKIKRMYPTIPNSARIVNVELCAWASECLTIAPSLIANKCGITSEYR